MFSRHRNENLLTNVRFRWIYCQIQGLRKCRSRNEVQKALKTLPKTLGETYQRILEGIDEDDRQLARSTLQWFIYSDRTWSVKELAEVAILNPDADIPFDVNDRFESPRDILQVLSSFVTTYLDEWSYSSESEDPDGLESPDEPAYELPDSSELLNLLEEPAEESSQHFSASDAGSNLDNELSEFSGSPRPSTRLTNSPSSSSYETQEFDRPNKLVRIAHFSVQEWMTSDRSFFPETELASQQAMAKSCLYYIDFYHRTKDSDILFDPGYHSLLYYCAWSWQHHAKPCEATLYSCTDPTCERLSDESWLKIFNELCHHREEVSPLSWAAYVGFHCVVERLLDSGADVNSRGGDVTALQEACRGGNAVVVKLLLEKGADVNLEGGRYGNAL